MPDLPENEQPNVLTREEAALLVKANEQPRPDSDEEAARFSAILDRLAEWAEQPEESRVYTCQTCGKSGTEGVLCAAQKKADPPFHCNGGTGGQHHKPVEMQAVEPAPPNLAEKLRERALNSPQGSRYGGLQDAANALDRAIPPEVWGRVIALHSGFAESDVADEPPVSDYCAALDALIATYCPPHIQQQHGWEPRREETSP